MNDSKARALVWRLHELSMRVLKRIVGLHLFRVELGDDRLDISPPELAPGYETKIADPLDLLKWATTETGLTSAFLQSSAKRGDRCVINVFNEQLVGYGFIAQSRAPVTDQIEVRVSSKLIYRYKGWTHPEHRRKHLSHARGRLNKQLFFVKGGSHTVSYVETHNHAARANHPDVHPRLIGYCGFIRFAGREYPFNLCIRTHGFCMVRTGTHHDERRENQR